MSENKKGYLVVIKPDEKIEILPYKDYKDIQKGVGGHFERLHSEPVGDKDYTTQCINGSFTKGKNQFTVLSKDFYCNEEYLLSDECKFNPLATLLTQDVTDAGYTKNPVYGNVAVLKGCIIDDEYDNIGFNMGSAEFVRFNYERFAKDNKDVIEKMNSLYAHCKPEPVIRFQTYDNADDFLDAISKDDDMER